MQVEMFSVKQTFGNIVKRELNIAKDKNRWQKKRFDVDATFERKHDEKPPSCGPAPSDTTSTYVSYLQLFVMFWSEWVKAT